MRKKQIISDALAASVAVAATLGGCSLVTPNTSADMTQVIAEVNVANAAALDKELGAYKDAVGTSTVIKRELVAYFLNVGYSYVQSGLSYENVFNMLMNALVENSVLTQYATLYLLKNKADTENKSAETIISEYTALETQAEKYEYLLGGKGSKDVILAEYSLLSTLNNAIDSYEKKILTESDSSNGSETRSTPANVDTEKDDYYPVDDNGKLDYNVYTGYEGYLLSNSGAYQKDALDKTRRATRIRAYNEFISSLASSSYDLVDKSKENLRDVRSLSYIQDEYVSQLEQRIINKYYDLYEEEREELLKGKGEDAYSYIQAVYEDLLNLQTKNYSSEDAFSKALGNMNDSTFVLYAPDTSEDKGVYGFVYNILLPFSAAQSVQLSALQTRYADSEKDGGYSAEYYIQRNELLRQIETTDQRSAWFNGETDYAYKKDGVKGQDYYGNSGWLFFENNLEYTYKYESLEKYAGAYSFNGTVHEADGDYVLYAKPLNIDNMLDEFVGYINYVTGTTTTYTKNDNYYNLSEATLYKKVDDKDKIDYSNFVYAGGKVKFNGTENGSYVRDDEAYNRANLLNKESKQYKALSAVNELQYAYTTDTGVLSQYIGYSVEAGDTSYIKEFEYAAHEAIKAGAGSFAVCAGDYGWHLIYVTYTFDNASGNQYTPNWKDNVDVEGTFENLFYEYVKSNDIKDISTTRRTQILAEFNLDSTVTKYQSRYQDLLDLKNETGSNSTNN